MLKSIVIVTLLVTSVTRSEQAYERDLSYQTVDEGRVAPALAAAWGAPAATGKPFVLMRPSSDSAVYLRFIEAPNTGNYAPMRTLGWNAVELQAEDPDSLVTEVSGADFEMIGPPAWLTSQQNIRAAQVLGPHQELLYFTHVLDPAQSRFRIGTAQSRVDRVFIMVLGTADLGATTSFYQDVLGMAVAGPFPYRVSVLSRAWGLPEDTLHDLSIVQLEEDFLIEIDAYPAAAPLRSDSGIGLPYGAAIVSFRVGDLSSVERQTGRRAASLSMAPYDGREMLFLTGPSGEGIELVARRRNDG